MIDYRKEFILSLAEATREVPKVCGKHPNPSTIFRWTREGVRGVRLDSVRFGRRICTSREALQRFLVELSEAPAPTTRPPQTTATRSEAQRDRAVAAAYDRLTARGLVKGA